MQKLKIKIKAMRCAFQRLKHSLMFTANPFTEREKSDCFLQVDVPLSYVWKFRIAFEADRSTLCAVNSLDLIQAANGNS